MSSKFFIDSGDKEFKLYVSDTSVLNEEEYAEVQNKDEYSEETVKFYKPGWLTLKSIDQVSSDMLGLPNHAAKSRMLLVYLLRDLSFVDVNVKENTEGDLVVANADKLFGDNGLRPSILNKIDAEIRERLD